MATSGPCVPPSFALRRWLAALLAVWGSLGMHLGPHGHSGEARSAADTLTTCAHHHRAPHVEPRHALHFRECPACLVSHSNLGAVRPLSPAPCLAAPEGLPATPTQGASLLTPGAPSSRGPPVLSA